MAEVILCEKPKVGRDTARLLGIQESRDGYIVCRGGSTIVTWAIGHLLEQAAPDEYDPRYRRWAWQDLPILPETFKVSPNLKTKGQLKVIKQLLAQASRVLIATDAGREGELIAREILDHCGYRGLVDRVWSTAQDDASLLAALHCPLPGAKTEPLYRSALARQRSDWLVGMNLSRAVTLRFGQKTGSREVHSIGRVKTPTLTLVYRRDESIRAFVAREYFELGATVRAETGLTVELVYRPKDEDRLFERAKADALRAAAQGARGSIRVETQPKKEEPPKLFDLTELQKCGNARFGWSAKRTLELAQALYQERKAITYPRSDCPYLPESQIKDTPAILAIAAAALGDPALALLQPVIRKSVFNDAKMADQEHNAIIPTAARQAFEAFSPEEAKLYRLILRRYVAALMPAREYDETVIGFEAAGITFKTKGQVTRVAGWRALYADGDERAGDPKEDALPPIADGMSGVAESVVVLACKTTPPAAYTEATLLEDMKSVAKFVTNPAHKQRLKETSGIGTVATRAAILEELKSGGYLLLAGKHLRCAPKGRELIAWLDAHLPRLTDPGETALWEDAFLQIEKGEVSVEQFVAGIAQVIRQHLGTLERAIPEEALKPTAVPCPSGKGVLLEGEARYQSPGYPALRLPKVVCGVAVGPEDWAKTLAGEKLVRDGFVSKEKKRFRAALAFNRDQVKIEFDFEAAAVPPQTVKSVCPRSGQPVLDAGRWFSFPGWPEVRCWKVIAGRAMRPEEFIPALEHGRTGPLSGFKGKGDKPFAACVVLDRKTGRFGFDFLPRGRQAPPESSPNGFALKLTRPRGSKRKS